MDSVASRPTPSTSTNVDVKKTLQQNVKKVVMYLKEELVKATQDGEQLEETAAYGAMLVQAIHACAKEYPDVVAPVLMDLLQRRTGINTSSHGRLHTGKEKQQSSNNTGWLDWDINTAAHNSTLKAQHRTTTKPRRKPTSSLTTSAVVTDDVLHQPTAAMQELAAVVRCKLCGYNDSSTMTPSSSCRAHTIVDLPIHNFSLARVRRGAHRTTPKRPLPCRTPRRSTAAAPYTPTPHRIPDLQGNSDAWGPRRIHRRTTPRTYHLKAHGGLATPAAGLSGDPDITGVTRYHRATPWTSPSSCRNRNPNCTICLGIKLPETQLIFLRSPHSALGCHRSVGLGHRHEPQHSARSDWVIDTSFALPAISSREAKTTCST
ncbi:hypothetical protein EJB05_10474, partial [Eragrostis curvula]